MEMKVNERIEVYIKMNGRTYYIDDSTGEAIMDSWPEEAKQ